MCNIRIVGCVFILLFSVLSIAHGLFQPVRNGEKLYISILSFTDVGRSDPMPSGVGDPINRAVEDVMKAAQGTRYLINAEGHTLATAGSCAVMAAARAT